jgi:Fe-S-cluster-containing dehydrogenase component
MAKTLVIKKCEYCEKPYETGRDDSKYCTASCRTQAYNARLKKTSNKITEKLPEKVKAPVKAPTKKEDISNAGSGFKITSSDDMQHYMEKFPGFGWVDIRIGESKEKNGLIVAHTGSGQYEVWENIK